MDVISCRQLLGMDSTTLLDLLKDVQSRFEHQDTDPKITAEILLRRADFGLLYNILPSKEVRELSEKARDLFRAANDPICVYHCLTTMTRSYLKDQLYDAANKVIDQMQQLADSTRIPSFYDYHLDRVRCLKGSSQWDDSLASHIHQFIQASRASGNTLNIALGLKELGEVHVHKEEWDSAQFVYEEALEVCKTGTGYTFDNISRRCSNNLRYIESMVTTQAQDDVHFIPSPRW
jgi:hypothetical protein